MTRTRTERQGIHAAAFFADFSSCGRVWASNGRIDTEDDIDTIPAPPPPSGVEPLPTIPAPPAVPTDLPPPGDPLPAGERDLPAAPEHEYNLLRLSAYHDMWTRVRRTPGYGGGL